jgi:hypothetical protein
MNRKQLTADATTNPATRYATDSASFSVGTFVLLFIGNAGHLASPAHTQPAVSGNGLTWNTLASQQFGGNNRRLSCLYAVVTAPVSGPVTIDFGAELQGYCGWSMFAYDGVDEAATVANHVVVAPPVVSATSLSASTTPSGNADADLIATAIALSADEAVTPMSAYEIVDDLKTPVIGNGATLQTSVHPTTKVSPSWTWATNAAAAAIAVELIAVQSNTPPAQPPPKVPQQDLLTLIAQWEPVLRLAETETWLPCRAQNFFSTANRWTAQRTPGKREAPDDDRSKWGGPAGTPFPRTPDRSGQDPMGPSWFLELGGWTKSDGSTHENGVIDSGENRYADPTGIAQAYANKPELAASTDWYHAEFFNNQQLQALAGSYVDINLPSPGDPVDPTVTPISDITKTLATVPNAMLLCYYYFFPYHKVVAASTGCTNVEASQLATHAGDWQCVAYMFGGEGDFPTTPDNPVPATLPPLRFIGTTGLRPTTTQLPNGTNGYPPNSWDDPKCTVMKVDQADMAARDSVVIGGATLPVFYVAADSHSIYLKSGRHEVDPFPEDRQPQSCGKLDQYPAGNSPDVSALVVALKTLALFPFGEIWALAEMGVYDTGPDSAFDRPEADNTAVASDKASVGPDSVTIVPGWAVRDDASRRAAAAALGYPAGSDDLVRPWQWHAIAGWDPATQGAIANPDMIVDRHAQNWWPSELQWDSDKVAFNGHWGQCVSNDELNRRCGPRFPPYWRMFLTALEDGKTKGAFDFPFVSP